MIRAIQSAVTAIMDNFAEYMLVSTMHNVLCLINNSTRRSGFVICGMQCRIRNLEVVNRLGGSHRPRRWSSGIDDTRKQIRDEVLAIG